MKTKDIKRYITVTEENINLFIQCIMIARNVYIDRGKPIEDVNGLLVKFMKAKKQLRA